MTSTVSESLLFVPGPNSFLTSVCCRMFDLLSPSVFRFICFVLLISVLLLPELEDRTFTHIVLIDDIIQVEEEDIRVRRFDGL